MSGLRPRWLCFQDGETNSQSKEPFALEIQSLEERSLDTGCQFGPRLRDTPGNLGKSDLAQ